MKASPDEILEKLRPSLASLESRRLAVLAKRRTGTFWILGFVLTGLLLTLSLAQSGSGAALFVVLGTGLGALVCGLVFFGNSRANFQQDFKRTVVSQVAEALAPGISYRPSQYVSGDWFKRSGLFARPDRYRGEDYFIGKIGQTDLFFSEIHAEQKHTSTDGNGNTKTHYSTLFKGLFLVADFHKEFHSKVTITPDKLDGFGFLGKKLQNIGGRVERMENVEFEKLFCVKASDAIEARYILTPAMQERFLDLARKWSPKLSASFQDSLVYLALPTRQDWFEGNLHTPLTNTNKFRDLVAQLWLCFSIVEDLDLNTRIWTKK